MIARMSCLVVCMSGLWSFAHAQARPFPTDSIDRFVQAEMKRQHTPGMSVAVLVGDSVMLARGYGFANLELSVRASDSTIYQSGSVGKQFTSALVLMLVEEGRLGLSDPIIRYLPEGRQRWKGITIRHLLTHTSGIPEYTDSVVDLRSDYSEDRLVRLAAGLPLMFRPGARWSYSNTGYLLLGVLIHRVTGTFYGDLLRDSIFTPLGMRSARVISEDDIVPNRAAGYRLVHGEVKNQKWVAPSLNTTADGSLYLSLRDYERWAVALNHRERPSARVLDMAWTPVPLAGGGTYPYGDGWFLIPQRGHRRIGHTGAWQGFRTSIQRYPEFDMTVIVLANLENATSGPISEAIAGIVQPVLAASQTLEPDPSPDSLAAQSSRVLGTVAADRESPESETPGFRRFAAPAWRKELREDIKPVESWTPLTCDTLGSGAFMYLGAEITRMCYVRGTGPEASVLANVYFSADRRLAGIEINDY